MVLTLGYLEFQKVSGPTSLRVLTPTQKLKDLVEHYLPVLVLIGDIHDRLQGLCNNVTDSTLAVYTPLWLRLLDSLGCDLLPVDYFVEAFFPVELLRTPYYLQDANKRFLYKG